ncbi:hypothetical protein KGM_209893 [Danaus plexippus plexippus]|uniref:Tudor domain-containing protein 5 n=1 Tax=Danaus plexippus plexippus TaxID=278856 RepID=A0A212EJZ4_DANPL|nr:hypothetical protein KGM_209893 [Danaus plexippus plexippus]
MDEELKQLKSVLRSLVVSSATEVDVRTLLRDYRMMVGNQLPLAKFGYKEPVGFLKEYFSDCFLFTGPVGNPVLTLIVPDSLKHIDKFVQKQKVNNVKSKGKRRSVQESVHKPSESNLIVQTVNTRQMARNQKTPPLKNDMKINQQITKEVPTLNKHHLRDIEKNINNPEVKANEPCSQTALQNFLKKRTPLFDCQLSNSDKDFDKDSDSGRLTSSSTNSKRAQREQLHKEIKDIVVQSPHGVSCTDLMRLYRARYSRELNFTRVGYTSVLSAACAVDGLQVSRRTLTDDWLLSDAARPPPPAAPAPPRPPPAPSTPAQPEDALPGIDFEPDVFPPDCMHLLESIPSVSLADVKPGDMLEVAVAEVYSPSHFWLLRLGEDYNIAMEEIMDDMNQYYGAGEGRDRSLALGAVREGHYCASLYDGDWHRSIIVRILDHDTVKVRHVDYGTVERVATSSLRVLLRRYAALEAQAVRARLGGVAPPAAGRRWPHASSHRFLRLVRDRRLVANVVATHGRERALEVLLIDTSTAEDRCLAAELVRSGHADPRPAPLAVAGHTVSTPPSLSEDDAESVRARPLLLDILRFGEESRSSDESEVSQSASQTVGRAPRSLASWSAGDRDSGSEGSGASSYTTERLGTLNVSVSDAAHGGGVTSRVLMRRLKALTPAAASAVAESAGSTATSVLQRRLALAQVRHHGPRRPVRAPPRGRSAAVVGQALTQAGGSQTSECYLYPRFEALEAGDTPSFAEVHAYLRDGIALDFVHDYRRHVPPGLPPDRPATTYEPPPLLPGDSLASSSSSSSDSPHNEHLNPSPSSSSACLSPTSHRPPHPSPGRGVSLSAAECEAFCVLSRVDPGAAHRFMLEAMSRGLFPASSPANPEAMESRSLMCPAGLGQNANDIEATSTELL